MQNSALYEVALSLIPGIGNVLTKQLVSYCGSAQEVFKKPRGKLMKIPNIGPKIADAIVGSKVLNQAEEELNNAERLGAEILFYTSSAYPKRLSKIINAPILLYYKGEASLNADKVLSIVGTRRATNYGREFIEKLVAEFKTLDDLIIVSGLAYGIDIQAHKVSLKHNIPTVGVMANGLDMVYPADHKETARKMIEQGGLLTENKFGTKPDAPKFPERNRIIAGIADAVLVVEATASGGALITAEIANSFDIDVMALPGGIHQKSSEGCNKLIKEHKAHLVTSAADVISLLNWDIPKNTLKKKLTIALDQEEQIIYDLLTSKEHQIDELSYKSRIPIGKLPAILLNMELKGLLKPYPGQKYKLI